MKVIQGKLIPITSYKKPEYKRPASIQPRNKVLLPDYKLSQEANVADINIAKPNYSGLTPTSLKTESANVASAEVTVVKSSLLSPKQMGQRTVREDLTLQDLFLEKAKEEEI